MDDLKSMHYLECCIKVNFQIDSTDFTITPNDSHCCIQFKYILAKKQKYKLYI